MLAMVLAASPILIRKSWCEFAKVHISKGSKQYNIQKKLLACSHLACSWAVHLHCLSLYVCNHIWYLKNPGQCYPFSINVHIFAIYLFRKWTKDLIQILCNFNEKIRQCHKQKINLKCLFKNKSLGVVSCLDWLLNRTWALI